MLRTFSYAAAAATLAATSFAPIAMADSQPVKLSISVDAAQITDTRSAEKTLNSLERQAKKACSWDVQAIKRKKTDWVCVNEIVEQVVTQLDIPQLTSAYANSDMVVRLADNSATKPAL